MALSSFQFFFTLIFEPPPIDTSHRRTLYTMSESHICEHLFKLRRCGPEGVSAYWGLDCIKQVIFFLFLSSSLGQRTTNQMLSLREL